MQSGVKDQVTGEIKWNGEWTQAQSLPEVESPTIPGYQADKAKVEAMLVSHDDQDKEITVTYHKADQKAKLSLIDDEAKAEIQHLDASGSFRDKIVFGTDIALLIKHYEEKGYELVSNSFKDQSYQADDSQNQFEIHFKHKKQKVYESKKINETIHYIDEEGKQVFGDYQASPLKFERQGMKDMVSGDAQWEEWTKDQTFDAVASPALEGYEADPERIDEQTVGFDSQDLEFTVVYRSNYNQMMTVRPHDEDISQTPNVFEKQVPLKSASTVEVPEKTATSPSKEHGLDKFQKQAESSALQSKVFTDGGSLSDSNNDTLNAKDTPSEVLPQTGNSSTTNMTLSGIAMMFASLLGLKPKRNKQDE
ncbi:hypothetical protein AYP89_09290 [Lactobacillus crispatus]|nr:hypothetical protein AYP87_07725 [Lactobacillus crispatus]OXC33596.1 hypothetical protein AYP89_09290 [Lactobacillus crispatus]